MPEYRKPRTKLDALIDPRPCFNAIRKGFLELYGRDLKKISKELENTMSQFCPELRADPLIVELQAAVLTIVEHQLHELHAPPPGFVDEVWPYYLDALENGEANQSYWLSYVELLAVANNCQREPRRL